MSGGINSEIVACLPHLRAFARSLARDRDRADDLVHDAVVRALNAADRFTPGTNFKAWIFTILRNVYFNEFRRRDAMNAQPLEAAEREGRSVAAAQEVGLEMEDFRRAFMKLPPEQREALVLVGASGFKYDEAASICGCATGTVKSRVARGRRALAEMLSDDYVEPPASDRSPAQGTDETETTQVVGPRK